MSLCHKILTKTNNDDDPRHRYSTTERAGDASTGGAIAGGMIAVKENRRGTITGDAIAGDASAGDTFARDTIAGCSVDQGRRH
jgi:hypothetical protein